MRRAQVLLLVSLLCLVSRAQAVSEGTFLFLQLPPSPQANGMAGIYSAAGNHDPLAPLTVPGTLGLMAEHDNYQLAFYPKRTDWLPQFDLDDLTFAARCLYLGLNRQWVKEHFDSDSPVSFGLGYYEVDLDLGNTERTNSEGVSLGSFHSEENCKAIGLGMGYHPRFWQAGVGLNLKFIDSELAPVGPNDEVMLTGATERALDVGVLFRTPIIDWFNSPSKPSSGLLPVLTPELSYSLLNFGGEVSYDNSDYADPMSRTGKMHLGIESGLNYVYQSEFPPFELLRFNWSRSSEDILIHRNPFGSYYYRSLLADIDPINDLLLGKSNSEVIQKKGWELCFFESVWFRRGRWEDADGRVFLNTEGYGFGAGGLFKQLATVFSEREHKILYFVFRHVDVAYHHSTRLIPDEYNHPLNNTRDEQLSLRFRY